MAYAQLYSVISLSYNKCLSFARKSKVQSSRWVWSGILSLSWFPLLRLERTEAGDVQEGIWLALESRFTGLSEDAL